MLQHGNGEFLAKTLYMCMQENRKFRQSVSTASTPGSAAPAPAAAPHRALRGAPGDGGREDAAPCVSAHLSTGACRREPPHRLRAPRRGQTAEERRGWERSRGKGQVDGRGGAAAAQGLMAAHLPRRVPAPTNQSGGGRRPRALP